MMKKSIVPPIPYEMVAVSKRRAVLFWVLLVTAGCCVLGQWFVVGGALKIGFTVAFVVFLVAAVLVLVWGGRIRGGSIGKVIH